MKINQKQHKHGKWRYASANVCSYSDVRSAEFSVTRLIYMRLQIAQITVVKSNKTTITAVLNKKYAAVYKESKAEV